MADDAESHASNSITQPRCVNPLEVIDVESYIMSAKRPTNNNATEEITVLSSDEEPIDEEDEVNEVDEKNEDVEEEEDIQEDDDAEDEDYEEEDDTSDGESDSKSDDDSASVSVTL